MSDLRFLAVPCLLVALTCLFLWNRQVTSLRLPPGPTPDLFLGHARKVPVKRAWEVYTKWKKAYGDVVYTYTPTRRTLVLNSIKAARDLLDQKSLTFSDRPPFPIFNLMGWGIILPLLGYGPRFRKQRKIVHQYFGPQSVATFRPTQERELHKFLKRLLKRPENFSNDIHTMVAGIIVSLTYGHEVVSENDGYVELVERALHETTGTGTMGTTVFDTFPFLFYLPAWLPGMALKRVALNTRALVTAVMKVPLDEVKAKRASGNSPPCLVSDLLDKYEESNVVDLEHEEDIMSFGATVYNAGTDTTRSTITLFFMLMILYPEAAKRAQEEIDSVIGRDRLPTFEDRESLPYIDCILKEIYRIQPPVPLGIPHRSTEVEQYRDWTIPKGTVAVANIWQMMKDETIFPSPQLFRPERHSGKTTSDLDAHKISDDTLSIAAKDDPSDIVFGFGRRVCPGKAFADSSTWLTMANVLSMFDIKPYTNPNTGLAELPQLDLDDRVILRPKSFKCSITPRKNRLDDLYLITQLD